MEQTKGLIEKYHQNLKQSKFIMNPETKRLFRTDVPRIKFVERK
jgi:hypothetical protein